MRGRERERERAYEDKYHNVDSTWPFPKHKIG
ncbi:hypothetical protein OIU78_027615 [Salix suchowensis]|nr:hypothetical protein OIU78_027615 [Salix suchowensis]